MKFNFEEFQRAKGTHLVEWPIHMDDSLTAVSTGCKSSSILEQCQSQIRSVNRKLTGHHVCTSKNVRCCVDTNIFLNTIQQDKGVS